jgi:GNAT superfamily N-acetyltransferase
LDAYKNLRSLPQAVLPPRDDLVDARIAGRSVLLSLIISVIPSVFERELLSRGSNDILLEIENLQSHKTSPRMRDKLLALMGASLPGEKWLYCNPPVDEAAYRSVCWTRGGNIKGFVIWDANVDGQEQIIHSVWVSPEYRRLGVARELLRKAVDYARRHRKREVVLCISESRVEMCSLARDIGMSVIESKQIRTAQGTERILNFGASPEYLSGYSVGADAIGGFVAAVGGYANALALVQLRRECLRLQPLLEMQVANMQRYLGAKHRSQQLGAKTAEKRQEVGCTTESFSRELRAVASQSPSLQESLGSYLRVGVHKNDPDRAAQAVAQLLASRSPAQFRQALRELGPAPWVDAPLRYKPTPDLEVGRCRLRDPAVLTGLRLAPGEEDYRVHEGGFAEAMHGNGRHVVVARRSGVPCGFALTSQRDSVTEIVRFLVDLDARRKGAGGRLIDRVIYDAWRSGSSCVVTHVPLVDVAVLKFLSHRGFKAPGDHPLGIDGYEIVKMVFTIGG